MHTPPFKQRGHPRPIALNENRKLEVANGDACDPENNEYEGKRNTDIEFEDATKGTHARGAGVAKEGEFDQCHMLRGCVTYLPSTASCCN